jgi:hypothetical protein
MNIFRHIETEGSNGMLIDVIYNITDGYCTPEDMKVYRIENETVVEQMNMDPSYRLLYLVNIKNIIESANEENAQ